MTTIAMARLGMAILALVSAQCVPASARDPFTGTWELDREASSLKGQSQRLTIEASPDGERYRSELTDDRGRWQVTDYTAGYDGKEYASETVVQMDGRSPVHQSGTVLLRRIDALNRERIWKRDGQVFRILRRSVSTDGSLLTSRITDIAAAHKADAEILVFRRMDRRPLAFESK